MRREHCSAAVPLTQPLHCSRRSTPLAQHNWCFDDVAVGRARGPVLLIKAVKDGAGMRARSAAPRRGSVHPSALQLTAAPRRSREQHDVLHSLSLQRAKTARRTNLNPCSALSSAPSLLSATTSASATVTASPPPQPVSTSLRDMSHHCSAPYPQQRCRRGQPLSLQSLKTSLHFASVTHPPHFPHSRLPCSTPTAIPTRPDLASRPGPRLLASARQSCPTAAERCSSPWCASPPRPLGLDRDGCPSATPSRN